MKIRNVMMLMLGLSLYSCSTMDANECLSADWQLMGFRDGGRGYSIDRFQRYHKACSKHGVGTNFSDYKIGYGKGVLAYCTGERGYRLGKHGKAFPTICPAQTVNTVRRGYNVGLKVHQKKSSLEEKTRSLSTKLEEIDISIASLNSERMEHEQYLQLAESGLLDPNIKGSERLIFYTQRAEMKKLIQENEQKVHRLEDKKSAYQKSIEKIKKTIQDLDNRPMPKL